MFNSLPKIDPSGTLDIKPGIVKDLAADTDTIVFKRSDYERAPGRITVQNVGTNPLYFAYNTPVNPSTAGSLGVYNGIIGGGAANEDGRGGMLTLSKDAAVDVANIAELHLYSILGTRVCVTVMLRGDVIGRA